MNAKSRMRHVLSLLLSVGVAGASTALATAHAKALPEPSAPSGNGAQDVAQRLASIREASPGPSEIDEALLSDEDKVLLAQWINFSAGGGGVGWRNGGWGNGGWHNWGNGGWHNAGWGNGGWHNGGWGNGGWHNWGNGWHNFWHNW